MPLPPGALALLICFGIAAVTGGVFPSVPKAGLCPGTRPKKRRNEQHTQDSQLSAPVGQCPAWLRPYYSLWWTAEHKHADCPQPWVGVL